MNPIHELHKKKEEEKLDIASDILANARNELYLRPALPGYGPFCPCVFRQIPAVRPLVPTAAFFISIRTGF